MKSYIALVLAILGLVVAEPSRLIGASPSPPSDSGAVDAADVPQNQWEPNYEIEALRRLSGNPSDVTLKPIQRTPALYKDVQLAATMAKRPRPRLMPVPRYPNALALCGVPGRVLVAYSVNSAGDLLDPKIIEASDERFADAVLSALPGWKYVKEKQRVKARALCVIEFTFRVNGQ